MKRRFSFLRVAAFAGLLALVWGVANAALHFPPLTGRVVDQANILSDDAKTRLTAMSQALEEKTTDQFVVVTLKSLEGNSIEQYGYQLGRTWGIGQKGKNNGVLLIVAPAEHKLRIEVGYGLEGELTDAQSKLIIQNIITPAFKRGDYDGGVLAGSAAILQVLGVSTQDAQKVLSEQAAQPEQQQNDDDHPILTIVWIIMLWLVLGRFLWPLLFLTGIGRGSGQYFGTGGLGGGGGFGGGFGGGGFSGGGGSFGGGGASGGW